MFRRKPGLDHTWFFFFRGKCLQITWKWQISRMICGRLITPDLIALFITVGARGLRLVHGLLFHLYQGDVVFLWG